MKINVDDMAQGWAPAEPLSARQSLTPSVSFRPANKRRDQWQLAFNRPAMEKYIGDPEKDQWAVWWATKTTQGVKFALEFLHTKEDYELAKSMERPVFKVIKIRESIGKGRNPENKKGGRKITTGTVNVTRLVEQDKSFVHDTRSGIIVREIEHDGQILLEFNPYSSKSKLKNN